MDWTAEAIDQLRAFWDEGHSTAEIGRRMGISKNAVVGKAHRLDLPPRPSPIRREGAAPAVLPLERTPPQPRRAPAPAPQPPRAAAPAPQRPAALPPQPGPQGSPVLRGFTRATRSCCWPLGEPGTSGFRFCAGEALTGKPYCPEHAAVAYVKARDRREDAA